ncbi:MAG TPA: 3-phosphoshikimate 1-carboxyvinyltransferase [Ktedonobacterales bacterium]|nr:3-phosphoshikimate 1-carboxyvinyltransferase [Ktedonobacterales bacterium]
MAPDTSDADLPPTAQPPRAIFVGPPVGDSPTRPPHLPGSKYYTLRYLLNALLADGESVVEGPALSDDTGVLVRAMRALGGSARWEREHATGGWNLRIVGVGGRPKRPEDGALRVGNAGAVLRLLLGICALLPDVRFETDHPDSLGRRPNGDLLDALRSLGIEATAREPGGLLPITLRGGPPRGGAVSVSGRKSSQYLSALLYLAPLLSDGLDITVTDELRSQPLVRATLRALAEAGVAVEAAPSLLSFHVAGGQRYQARHYRIPGDTPSTAALLAASVALGAPLRLDALATRDDDLRALLAACDTLGLPLASRPTDAAPEIPLTLAGGPAMQRPGWHPSSRHIDGDAIIDSVPALVALACLIPGVTRFERVATLRLKESDRIEDLCAELSRAGADVSPLPDAIIVRGTPEGIAGGVTVQAHDDHRLAQALAIVATRSQRGLTIAGADAVAKSYPWFFDDLGGLGAKVRVVEV